MRARSLLNGRRWAVDSHREDLWSFQMTGLTFRTSAHRFWTAARFETAPFGARRRTAEAAPLGGYAGFDTSSKSHQKRRAILHGAPIQLQRSSAVVLNNTRCSDGGESWKCARDDAEQ